MSTLHSIRTRIGSKTVKLNDQPFKQTTMKANINGTDKITRIVLAMILAASYFTDVVTGTAGIVVLIVGGVLLLTAFMNFCPIYHFLGLSTKKSTTDTKSNN